MIDRYSIKGTKGNNSMPNKNKIKLFEDKILEFLKIIYIHTF